MIGHARPLLKVIDGGKCIPSLKYDYQAFTLLTAASKFAQFLLEEHAKRCAEISNSAHRCRNKGFMIEPYPEDRVVNAAVEILYERGYFANVCQLNIPEVRRGYGWLSEHSGSFEHS